MYASPNEMGEAMVFESCDVWIYEADSTSQSFHLQSSTFRGSLPRKAEAGPKYAGDICLSAAVQ